MAPDLLRSLGQRARARRLERGWTLREIAERSGVSTRFLVQLEAGRGLIAGEPTEVGAAFAIALGAHALHTLRAQPGQKSAESAG